MLHEARYYEQSPDGCVVCRLCPKGCRIAPGRRGVCLGRENEGGRLYARSYGQVVSIALDPIEKKPLYHFHPGAQILSIATYGCNLSCPFCQNAEISKHEAPGRYLAPDELVALARHYRSIGVACTYTEPLVWFEYLMDALPLVRQAGMKNVLVTNGMIDEVPLAELLPLVDALNIDLKSIAPEYYREFLGGDLTTVLNTIRRARAVCHVELTTLLVTGRNDSDDELRRLVDFVAGLGRSTVLHFSRYFPHYRLDLPPTPLERLRRARELAREKLDYVYLGNVPDVESGNDTLCPGCGSRLVRRSGFAARVEGVEQGRCRRCGRPADLVL